MRIHDNGNTMQAGQLWWVAWFPSAGGCEPIVQLARVIGDRPYQQLEVITGAHPADVWVLRAMDDTVPATVVRSAGSTAVRAVELA